MADPRFQVFVSSTYTDLVEERQAAISALLQLGAMPAGMELFPAADDEAWTLIRRVIDESDYYLLIIGGRYGSVTAEGISFTEKEYDYAESHAKPVMAFLHGSPGSIALDRSEVDPTARERLLAFRSKVEARKHVKFWSSAEDLAGKIALSYSAFTRTYPATGWIKADSGDSPETLKRLAEAQQRLSELEGLIDAQADRPPAESQGLADNDERLEFQPLTSITIHNLNDKSNIAARQRFYPNCSISWNEALFELGPMLVNEAPEQALQERFATAVADLRVEEITDEAQEWLSDVADDEIVGLNPNQSRPKLNIEVVKVEPDKSDFETVLLQLQALGLITQSERKRQISDRRTYWTLTPWGGTRLRRLRAVRAGATRPPGLEETPASDKASGASQPVPDESPQAEEEVVSVLTVDGTRLPTCHPL